MQLGVLPNMDKCELVFQILDMNGKDSMENCKLVEKLQVT